MNKKCPCGSNKNYSDCCRLYISGIKLIDSPEQLMRSRYTAYSMANIDYIVNTMSGKALQDFVKEDSLIWAKSISWKKLEVLSTNLITVTKGFVEFKAYFIDSNQQCVLHENSEFCFYNGRWFYVDGIIFD